VRHGGYRSLFGGPSAMYGGQLVGQGLAAALATLPADWLPRQLNAYFLRRGRPDEATTYTVETVHDGRTFKLRRVGAHQDGRLLFTMEVASHPAAPGPSGRYVEPPAEPAPDDLPLMPSGHLFGMEARLPPQPTDGPWPTRYWVRTADPVDGITGECMLAYVSDTNTPLFPEGPAHHGPTVTHSVWFHRPIDPRNWLLVDLRRCSVAAGIGFYTGSVFDRHGDLVATIAQSATFRIADG
jgi:acyl-CoA thioesterase-2